MKKESILFLLWICAIPSLAQSGYWQQKIDYEIEVNLDDQNHILRGFEKITYTNNSPDTLHYLFIHLYPNAYKNDHTPFAKQQVENGDTKFYYSKSVDRGFIDSLEFKSNDFPLNSSMYNNQEDIMVLELIEPLLPGTAISLSTPFRVVIPKNFSRFGHEGQTYQVSQWFPKPAVYDATGWHPMSYLDQGEFYDDFGHYDVKITLPKNYVVASTGDLQTKAEKTFLDTKEITKDIDASKIISSILTQSSSEYKTLHFVQNNVHDFAWFADKRFLIERTSFTLPSGKSCEAISYFTPENMYKYKGSSKILSETATYLSTHVGEYPYNHISVVDGPLFAGGGMEYPNIAIIGKMSNQADLNSVIIHEAGHNWFQGLLASNERSYPWLDEGVNSFYESKMEAEFKKNGYKVSVNGGNEIVYFLNGYAHKDQPINEKSENYTNLNYGGVVYAKAAKSLFYLESFMGASNFEAAMKLYFKNWEFKHPNPNDFRAAMEQHSTKDLSWYFDVLLNNDRPIDVLIKNVRSEGETVQIEVEDKFKGQYPVEVFAMKDTIILARQWTANGVASFSKEGGITHFEIDRGGNIPEINTDNNMFILKGIFKRGTPSLKLGTHIGVHPTNKIFLLPSLGFNHYDRFMIGALLHNVSMPNKNIQYAFAPMYATGTKSLVGTGIIGISVYPTSTFRKITFSVQGGSFHNKKSNLNITSPIYTRYYKWQPKIRLELPVAYARSPITRAIEFSYFGTHSQQFNYTLNPLDSLIKPSIADQAQINFFRANYSHHNNRTFNPFSYKGQAEVNLNFAKLTAESNIRIDYFMPKKALYVRAFAGKFLAIDKEASLFDQQPFFLNTTSTSLNDYGYENYFVGRNEFKGWKSQQVLEREGGFVSRTSQYANPLGRTNNWLVALNLRSDIPINFPILPQLFFNAAGFADAGLLNPSGAKMLFEGGLSLSLYKDIVRISLPLILSKDFSDYNQSIYSKPRLLQQISFSIQTDKLDFMRTQDVMNLFIN